jgi:hypothetical protein
VFRPAAAGGDGASIVVLTLETRYDFLTSSFVGSADQT